MTPTVRSHPWALLSLASVLLSLTASPVRSQEAHDWSPAPGLKTRWAGNVDPESPLPEYPRPQMVRGAWQNLNGLWELAVQPRGAGRPSAFPDRILVPYPVESALGGLARTVTPEDRVWYRRTFTLPDVPEGSRWLLHFGAVDWEAEVSVNGVSLGTHRGGYDPFTLDLTGALRPDQVQELVVAVWDPTSDGEQPRGKQVLDPHGIWYTAVTGIWQTVWLEPVPEVHVAALRMEPDLREETLRLTVEATGSSAGVPFRATVWVEDVQVAEGTGHTGAPVTIPVPDPRPWLPADPFLYDLRVALEGGDEVEGYFGMRSLTLAPDGQGHQRLILNGEPLFQYGLLDQGWWPDGLYTAPTDEALRFDVEMSKELGFNLIRKHVKVEPARWYYHCDTEGILVWQDMPSAGNETPESRSGFGQEMEAVVNALRNHPSIVMWVPFNEGWGQHETAAYVARLRELDPTRWVNNASGWTDEGVGDVLDIHRYPGPGAPDPANLAGRGRGPGVPSNPETPGERAEPSQRAGVLGEFGGLGLPLAGHTWVEEDNWGYRSFETLEALNEAYRELLLQLRPLIGEGLAAAVYTQTTDVEVEVNGVMTYDREVVKLDGASARANRELFRAPPVLRPLAATSLERGELWRFTTEAPRGEWTDPGFDDAGWREGPGGFGTDRTPGAVVRTPWESPDLWLRRTFNLPPEEIQGLPASRILLRIHHDEDAEVYLNGVEIATLEGFTTGYRLVPLTGEAVALLRSGSNLLAVHVRQTEGGQYIDAGIVEWVEVGGG